MPQHFRALPGLDQCFTLRHTLK